MTRPEKSSTTLALDDIERCYRRYGPMVHRRCKQLLRDEQAATDVAQDVFVRLLANRSKIEDRGLSSLLYRMATNLSLNHLRSRSRRPEDAASDLVGRIASAQVDEDERSAARSVIDRLFGREPVSSATIAVLHLVDGFTLKEVADQVGMSVSGVRKRLYKLRASLRELQEISP